MFFVVFSKGDAASCWSETFGLINSATDGLRHYLLAESIDQAGSVVQLYSVYTLIVSVTFTSFAQCIFHAVNAVLYGIESMLLTCNRDHATFHFECLCALNMKQESAY